MCLYSLKLSWWAPKTHVFLNRVPNGRSGSSKVVDFGTNQKRICDFLLVINSNLGRILSSFRDIAGFLLKIALHPSSTQTSKVRHKAVQKAPVTQLRCGPWRRGNLLVENVDSFQTWRKSAFLMASPLRHHYVVMC